MAFLRGATLGQYRIRRTLGEGGMGTVYEAVHMGIDRHVAIKVLHPKFASRPDAVKRFFNEARAVNRIEHPSVVPISEVNQLEDGTAYLVMEFLRGESLAARLKRLGGRLPDYEVVRFTRQLSSALAAAHAKGIVHRDLKPDNVMLVPDAEVPGRMRVRLLDFGIAKLLEPQGESPTRQAMTRADAVIGTPRYMSPEQCRGSIEIDEKTDVYALGVMLFEALVGRPPFVAQTYTEVMAMHIYEPTPPLSELVPEVPEALSTLIMGMLRKKKDDRPMMAQITTALSEPDIAPSISMSSISLRGFVLPDSLLGKDTEPSVEEHSQINQPRSRSLDELPTRTAGFENSPKRSSEGLRVASNGAPKESSARPPQVPKQSSSSVISTLGESAGQHQSPLSTLIQHRFLMAIVATVGLLVCGGLYLSLRPSNPTSAGALPPKPVPVVPSTVPPAPFPSSPLSTVNGASTATQDVPEPAPAKVSTSRLQHSRKRSEIRNGKKKTPKR